MNTILNSSNSTDSSVNEITSSDSHVLISNTVLTVVQWINVAILCQIFVLFGITTNIINIICFVTQGFQDPVNVSFLGLAVCDLGCLITLVWTNICFTPAFAAEDLPFDSVEIQYLTGGIPHTTFSRISAWITAFITLERCLCITAPLKIKQLITSKRVSIIMVCFFVILISGVAPIYVVCRFGTKYSPQRNKTLLGLVFTGNREMIEKVSFAINYVFIPYSAFVVIMTCTITLVVKLQKNTKWRMSSRATSQADNVSARNQKVAKMVVIISTLFVVCFFPISIVFLVMALDPRFSVGGKYINVLFLIGGVGILLESINSSVNIFVYYHMSSKFKNTFRQLFNMGTDTSEIHKHNM